MSQRGQRGHNPTIYVVSCPSASTQYSQLLATGTKSFQLHTRSGTGPVWLGWTSGAVTGSTYWSVWASGNYSEIDVHLQHATLFVASPVTGAVVEIVSWT